MTTLVDSERHEDAVLMGYDGATSRHGEGVALIREHGEFTLIVHGETVELGDMQAEYIARAILKALGK